MRIRKLITKHAVVYAPSPQDEATLRRIDERIASGSDALVLGTYPMLSLGYMDPRDFSCPYPLSNAFAVSKKILRKTGVLERSLGSMAATDLMRRIQAAGGIVTPAADILLSCHKDDAAAIADQLLDGIVLDAKYTGRPTWKRSFRQIGRVFKKDPAFRDCSRKALFIRMPLFLLRAAWYRSLGHQANGSCSQADLRLMRMRGEFLAPDRVEQSPLVSVVIRTRHRPEVLRKTLESLRYQSYPNIEHIVVEDGEPLSQTMIAEEFADLKIRYTATVQNIGRSQAANLGFSMSKGKYINLLDDDDYLYPEHIHTGVMAAESESCDMVFLQSLALLTTTNRIDPYEYEIHEIHFMNFPRIDPFTMAENCMTPDNGVLFSRALFEDLGGMRPDLNANEDWSLWLRYMTAARWTVVPYATCCFVNPFSEEDQQTRDFQYAPHKGMQLDDPTLVYKTSRRELELYYKGLIADWHCLSELGKLEPSLQTAATKHDVSVHKELMHFEKFMECISSGEEDGRMFTAKDFRDFNRGFIAHLLSLPQSERTLWIEAKYRAFF